MKKLSRLLALSLLLAAPFAYPTPAAAMPNACQSAQNVLSSAPAWSPQYWFASVYFITNC